MAAFVAIGLVWGAFMASLPDLKAAIGASDGQMGLVLIFGSMAAMSQMLAAPWLAGKLGRWAVPAGVIAMAAAVALPGHAGTAVALAFAMLCMGGSSGATDVWMNARLAAIEAERRLPLMNLNHAVYSFAYAGSAAVAGLARAAGYSPAAILTGVSLAVLALSALAWERDGRIDGMARARGAAPLGMVPWLAGGLVLIAFLAENAAEAWSALYVERDLGGATGAGALGPALLGLAMGIGRLAGQGLAMRLGEQRLLTGGLMLAALGAGLVALAPLPVAAYAAFAVMGLGVSVVVPCALTIVGRLAVPEARGRAIARATILGYMGFFLGPPVLGLVAEGAGLRVSYALVAVVLLGALVLAVRLARAEG